MGEDAYFNGERIKIGTAEDMLYLRADQLGLIRPDPRSIDPRDPEMQKRIRFRFPWPDEDGIPPGGFERSERALALHGLEVPEGVEHGSIQFQSSFGYVVSIPCPEGPAALALPVMKNGYRGDVLLNAQAYRCGSLVTICECGGCGSIFQVPASYTEFIQAMLKSLLAEALRRGTGGVPDSWYMKVAERVEAGYALNPGRPSQGSGGD